MRFRSKFRKCTLRMSNILTMHVPDSTPDYLRKRHAFFSCVSRRSDRNAGLRKGETHDPY
jgi:hypothetical protein